MTTVGAILTRARHPMRDAAEAFFTDAELIDYLNDAIADIAARERTTREETTVAVASGVLPIPADFLTVRWAIDPDGVDVAWLDESTFFSYVNTYPDWPSTSPLATIYEDAIHLHPTPANGVNYSVGSLSIPPLVDDVGDTFPLRRIWEGKCVAWLQSEMYSRDGELELSRRKHEQYEAGLRPAQAPTDHQVPGRVALAREPNAFDADPDSIHQGA